MQRKPMVLTREMWAKDDALWKGRFEGKTFGAEVTVLFFTSDETGDGPPLHVHDYDEVFILREGRARFTVGDEVFEAEAGQVVFAPLGIPHKFENLGPGRLETTDIHLSDHFAQTNLE